MLFSCFPLLMQVGVELFFWCMGLVHRCVFWSMVIVVMLYKFRSTLSAYELVPRHAMQQYRVLWQQHNPLPRSTIETVQLGAMIQDLGRQENILGKFYLLGPCTPIESVMNHYKSQPMEKQPRRTDKQPRSIHSPGVLQFRQVLRLLAMYHLTEEYLLEEEREEVKRLHRGSQMERLQLRMKACLQRAASNARLKRTMTQEEWAVLERARKAADEVCGPDEHAMHATFRQSQERM